LVAVLLTAAFSLHTSYAGPKWRESNPAALPGWNSVPVAAERPKQNEHMAGPGAASLHRHFDRFVEQRGVEPPTESARQRSAFPKVLNLAGA